MAQRLGHPEQISRTDENNNMTFNKTTPEGCEGSGSLTAVED
jgi:hypothetical protein